MRLGSRPTCLGRTPLLHLFEAKLPIGVPGALAGKRLPAPDDGVAIERVQFEYICPPAGLLGGDQRGARSGEGIEDDLAAP